MALQRGKAVAVPFSVRNSDGEPSSPDAIVESIVVVNGADAPAISTSTLIEGDVVTVVYTVPIDADFGDDHNVRLIVTVDGFNVPLTRDVGTVTESLDEIKQMLDEIRGSLPDGVGPYRITATVTRASDSFPVAGTVMSILDTSLKTITGTDGTSTLNVDNGTYVLRFTPMSGYDQVPDITITVDGQDEAVAITLTEPVISSPTVTSPTLVWQTEIGEMSSVVNQCINVTGSKAFTGFNGTSWKNELIGVAGLDNATGVYWTLKQYTGVPDSEAILQVRANLNGAAGLSGLLRHNGEAAGDAGDAEIVRSSYVADDGFTYSKFTLQVKAGVTAEITPTAQFHNTNTVFSRLLDDCDYISEWKVVGPDYADAILYQGHVRVRPSITNAIA